MAIEFRKHHTLGHPFQLQVVRWEASSGTCAEALPVSINTCEASSTNWSSSSRIRTSTR